MNEKYIELLDKYEVGNIEFEEMIDLFQYMLDNKLVPSVGHYQRTLKSLIENEFVFYK